MKKLMIALAAVAVGIAANAASFTWTTSGRIYDGSGNSGSDYYAKGQTAYLMFVSTISQADLVESFNTSSATAMSTVTGGKATSATVNSEGKVEVTTPFSSSVTESQTAYYVIFANDKMYVSGTTSAPYNSLDPDEVGAINFSAETSLSRATLDAANGYSTAGWYQASAVPEPTSGILLLLGVAGLALKRKRA